MNASIVFLAAAGALTLFSVQAAEVEYSISAPLGLTDAEHTDADDGLRISRALGVSASGLVLGESFQMKNSPAFRGASTWLYDGTNTTRISPTDSEHTRWFVGQRDSQAFDMNASGQVAGTAVRWPANSAAERIGETTWFYDGSNTINIGLTGGEHTRSSDNYRKSGFAQVNFGQTPYNSPKQPTLNDAGQVTGYSIRYDTAGSGGGQTAWLYDGTNTISIGLTDAEHTNPTNNDRSSMPVEINAAGVVAGNALRWDAAGTYTGQTAWLYDGSLANIGLSDSDHTRESDGKRYSVAVKLNNAANVAGWSTRYEPDGTESQSGWLYDGSDTTIINNDIPLDLNEAGQVLGNGWFYDGATVITTGLTDSEHTANGGSNYPLNGTSMLNNAGDVAGASFRYGSCTYCDSYGSYCETYRTENGMSTWLYDGDAFINISPVGSGRAGHKPNLINDAGQVAGYSFSYDCEYGSGNQSQSQVLSWFYDGQQTVMLDELGSRSWVAWLGDNGFMLGAYQVFESGVGNVAYAFVYSPEDGMRDLGLVVDDSFTQEDWARLASVLEANPDGLIIGTGDDATTASEMAYLLTPLPESATVNIDVLPGDAANQVYPNKLGILPVGILSSGEFDASQADPATLRFGSAQATVDDAVSIEDVDGQHGIDMTARFRVEESGILCDDTEVTLTGKTFAGDSFAGTDMIVATECETDGCHAY